MKICQMCGWETTVCKIVGINMTTVSVSLQVYAQVVLNCTKNFRLKKSAVYNGPVPLTARRKNES
jgi:hypothetical protein